MRETGSSPKSRSRPLDEPVPLNPFVVIFPVAFLVTFAVLWLASLPEFLAAENGLTSAGTPIGSGLYVLLCFVAALAVLAVLYKGRRAAPVRV